MKNWRIKFLWCVIVLIPACVVPACVQGRVPEWHDEIVDHFADEWKMKGHVLGREADHLVKGEWILMNARISAAPIAPVSSGSSPNVLYPLKK
jgi:hypothetical protein